MQCLLHDRVCSLVAQLQPIVYSAERRLIADTVSGLGRSEHTRPPRTTSVVTFSQARCVSCDTARAVGVGRAFSFQVASAP